VDGLSEQEAGARLAERGKARVQRSSRSYPSIVRANILTIFNLIIGAFGIVTLIFGDAQDALFLAIIVVNSAIGIFQEVKAKRQLDRLALLVAPHATVIRDGTERSVTIEQVVPGDMVALTAGDQVVADGELVAARDLQLDESILTGEAEPVVRELGDDVRSGAFVTEGTGAYRVTAVGAESFAERITGEAQSFRHARSPLERAVNRLLYATVAIVLVLGSALAFSLHHRQVGLHEAVSTATAGVVTLIPEGLMVLVSITYAASAARMSRRGILAQQLNAIESLAAVDTICVDKTGTLTEPTLRVVETVPAPGVEQATLEQALAGFAASASARNLTLSAVADAFPAPATMLVAETPFSSRRKWSAVQTADEALYLGAPGRVPVGKLQETADRNQREGRRVLALARAQALPAETGDLPPGDARPLGLVVLAEQLRPNIGETIAFLVEQGVEIKVLSGDDPRTVAAIARDVGIAVTGVSDGSEIPEEPQARREFARAATVVGRISPEGKQAIVQALRESGRYVAMIGDGVNDVPALKHAQLAIAQGSGAQMARSVSDLILVSGDFGSVPMLVAEGRQALRNLQRVAKLYVTKSALAAFLILTIGMTSEAYPLLPRHLSLAAALTIGIPTFFLALAPSSGPWQTRSFVREVSRFAVPAGFVVGTGLLASYLFARHDLDQGVPEARTVALTTLIAGGLYLVMALEAGSSRRRSGVVAGMCAVMALLYVLVLALPFARGFFEVSAPTIGMIATALGASAVAIFALTLCGFTLGTEPESRSDSAL
jgi:magnesium-transporting ATPase (P-type)